MRRGNRRERIQADRKHACHKDCELDQRRKENRWTPGSCDDKVLIPTWRKLSSCS